jgi:energy-converting hydrogenase Eha subunit G
MVARAGWLARVSSGTCEVEARATPSQRGVFLEEEKEKKAVNSISWYYWIFSFSLFLYVLEFPL